MRFDALDGTGTLQLMLPETVRAWPFPTVQLFLESWHPL